MPIIKSAKKRVRVARKATVRNAKTKRAMRDAIKHFRTSLTTRTNSAAALAEAQKTIDTAVKKNVINKNRAARKKSQLASEAKAAGVKLDQTSNKKTTKKATSTGKRSPTKKTAAKKQPAKKPTAKKSTTKK